MKIDNFIHDEEKGTITFDVTRGDVINNVEVKKTESGTSYTDPGDFAEDWTKEEYSQLDDFISGCSGMLHCFYHYLYRPGLIKCN